MGAKLAHPCCQDTLFIHEAPFINMSDELVTVMYAVCVISTALWEKQNKNLHVFEVSLKSYITLFMFFGLRLSPNVHITGLAFRSCVSVAEHVGLCVSVSASWTTGRLNPGLPNLWHKLSHTYGCAWTRRKIYLEEAFVEGKCSDRELMLCSTPLHWSPTGPVRSPEGEFMSKNFLLCRKELFPNIYS